MSKEKLNIGKSFDELKAEFFTPTQRMKEVYIECEKLVKNENDDLRYAKAYGRLAGHVMFRLIMEGVPSKEIDEAVAKTNKEQGEGEI